MTRFLCFLVADLSLALPVDQIAEVAPVPLITRIPRPAPHIEGLATLRGRAVPVMDLRKRLGLVNPVTDHRTRMIVARPGAGGEPLGLLVDAVEEILSLGDGDEAASVSAPRFSGGLLQRVIEVQGRQVFLPDLAKLASRYA